MEDRGIRIAGTVNQISVKGALYHKK